MPYTMNGVGTSLCGSRGDVGWGSFDAMEWVVVFFMPFAPIKAVHTFDWNGDAYRAIPIRWSFDLVLRTFFGRWRWGLVVAGVVLGGIGAIEAKNGLLLPLLLAGVFFLLVGVVIHLLLAATQRRTCDIRRVIGPGGIGTCDPALLERQLLEEIEGDPQMMYETRTHEEAVEGLLESGRYSRAMWAARVATALEDRQAGEALTDRVLHHPEVVEALAEVRRKPGRWKDVMLTSEERIHRGMQGIQQSE